MAICHGSFASAATLSAANKSRAVSSQGTGGGIAGTKTQRAEKGWRNRLKCRFCITREENYIPCIAPSIAALNRGLEIKRLERASPNFSRSSSSPVSSSSSIASTSSRASNASAKMSCKTGMSTSSGADHCPPRRSPVRDSMSPAAHHPPFHSSAATSRPCCLASSP